VPVVERPLVGTALHEQIDTVFRAIARAAIISGVSPAALAVSTFSAGLASSTVATFVESSRMARYRPT
jgi:type IV secretory pathway VirB3-like protein